MRTTDAVNGRWGEVFEHFGLPPITRGRHFKGECPLCGSKGSFRIDDKDGSGSYICKCGAGNGWKLIELTQGLQFKDAAAEIDKIIGNSFTNYRSETKESKCKRDVEVLKYRQAVAIRGTGAEKYLNSRGIYELPKRAIKVIGENMFAIATDSHGAPIYSHETYIKDGAKDNTADVSKRQRPCFDDENTGTYADSVAIRMFEPASCLGIAEGIETALSARQIYKCNVWSTMNSGLMKKLKAPNGVEHLMIFADNDKNGTGLAAAFECGRANILANNDVKKVTIRWPGDVEDFNDMLLDGSQVFEWVLSK